MDLAAMNLGFLTLKRVVDQTGGIIQGCIFRLTCSHPELTEDHVLTSVYVKIFRTVMRNAVNKLKEKRLFLTSLKQTCNEYLIKFSENQSVPNGGVQIIKMEI